MLKFQHFQREKKWWKRKRHFWRSTCWRSTWEGLLKVAEESMLKDGRRPDGFWFSVNRSKMRPFCFVYSRCLAADFDGTVDIFKCRLRNAATRSTMCILFLTMCEDVRTETSLEYDDGGDHWISSRCFRNVFRNSIEQKIPNIKKRLIWGQISKNPEKSTQARSWKIRSDQILKILLTSHFKSGQLQKNQPRK